MVTGDDAPNLYPGATVLAKTDRRQLLNRLQATARTARTALAVRLLSHGFYAGQDQIMLALAADADLSPGRLAERLGVRPPTVTKAINRLQAQGFVEKKPSNGDQRQALIGLTEKGQAAIKSIEKSLRKTEKQALKGLDKKDQKALAKLLARIEANLAAAGDLEDDEAAEAPADAMPADDTADAADNTTQ